MAGHGIAYVELYAKDKQRTARHLVSALGFACVADSVASDRSSLLLRQGTDHLVVTSGPATWKFLDAHGDGIADIALLCADVTATAERALRAGARDIGSVRGNPVLSGAGGLTHTLLPAERTRKGRPAGHRWVSLPRRPGPDAPARLEGVASGAGGMDLEECVRLYQEGFGLTPRRPERGITPDLTPHAAYLAGLRGGMTLALVAGEPGVDVRGGTGPHSATVDRATQRLSFRVDDIVHAARRLLDSGVEFRTPELREEPETQHRRLRLTGRSPHLGGTLLLELVQHGGPDGLGDDDLQELHGVVDQHRLVAR
ncbi:hypothetical protein ABZ871_40575 [Streptomyces populi]